MKKLLIALFALGTLNANAQTRTENFDTNSLGWTEVSTKKAQAVIKDGVMALKSKGGFRFWGKATPSEVETHCYSGLDVTKDFEIKCTAKAKKISKRGYVGVLLDYDDDGNYLLFAFDKKNAYLIHQKDGRMNGKMSNTMKFKKKKNAPLNLTIKNDNQKLIFFVNDMKILERRYLPLESDGFGFYSLGKQQVEFDEVKFIQ